MSLYIHEQLLLTHLIESDRIPRCVADIIASFAHVRDVCDLMKHVTIDCTTTINFRGETVGILKTKMVQKKQGIFTLWGFHSPVTEPAMENSHLYDLLYDEKGCTYARLEFNSYLKATGKTSSEGDVVLRYIGDVVEKQLHKFICAQKKQFGLEEVKKKA
jgi:hypothetical protein